MPESNKALLLIRASRGAEIFRENDHLYFDFPVYREHEAAILYASSCGLRLWPLADAERWAANRRRSQDSARYDEKLRTSIFVFLAFKSITWDLLAQDLWICGCFWTDSTLEEYDNYYAWRIDGSNGSMLHEYYSNRLAIRCVERL